LSGNNISANVYLGESSAPEVEAQILDRVGTYGRQLGQVSDAKIVLLKHLPNKAKLPADERKAIAAFEAMAYEIADIKEKHKRQAMRP
jgi:CHAD domain-containing protein